MYIKIIIFIISFSVMMRMIPLVVVKSLYFRNNEMNEKERNKFTNQFMLMLIAFIIFIINLLP